MPENGHGFLDLGAYRNPQQTQIAATGLFSHIDELGQVHVVIAGQLLDAIRLVVREELKLAVLGFVEAPDGE